MSATGHAALWQAIQEGDPRARSTAVLACGCGRPAARIYTWTDGVRYLVLPAMRVQEAESGRMVRRGPRLLNLPTSTTDHAEEPDHFQELRICRCGRGNLFSCHPTNAVPGWYLVHLNASGEEDYSQVPGAATVTWKITARSHHWHSGVFVLELGRATSGRLAE